jgi:cystathionine beta-lyase/cystathionine gamma-synthase
MTEPDAKPATSVAELDLHFQYQRRDMAALLSRLEEMTRTMATKSDIEAIAVQMRDFVRRGEFDDLKRKVADGNAGSTFWRFVEAFTKIGVAVGVFVTVCGLIAAAVHYADKVK